MNGSETDFGVLLHDFFCHWLLAHRNASPSTITSYRDTFRLIVRHIHEHTRKAPAALTLADLDAPIILDFLDHLERVRRNSIRSRNARLAAVRSFFRYVARREPVQLALVRRVLAIRTKRHSRPLLGFLSRQEVDAVQAAPDRATWSGRRDQALFAALYNTGARVSEIVDLRASDFTDGTAATLHLRGKGRKERRVPLWKTTARLLAAWLAENPGAPERPLFPNRGGQRMSRSGVASRLRLAVARASFTCPSLKRRRISPHTMRHTTAMHLLQSGVDITVIALWLGHESPSTTHLYLEAKLAMKQQALDKLAEPPHDHVRFTPGGDVLSFLDSL